MCYIGADNNKGKQIGRSRSLFSLFFAFLWRFNSEFPLRLYGSAALQVRGIYNHYVITPPPLCPTSLHRWHFFRKHVQIPLQSLPLPVLPSSLPIARPRPCQDLYYVITPPFTIALSTTAPSSVLVLAATIPTPHQATSCNTMQSGRCRCTL